MAQTFINQASNAFRIGIADPRSLSAGQIAFTNDAVAMDATKTEWDGAFAVGVVQNNGLVQAREFIAPTAQVLSANTTYSYRYFPTKESIPAVGSVDKLKRGWGGEFPYTSSNNELKAATLENVGISMVLEKAMSEQDPQYKARNFSKLVSILEAATLLSAFDALDSIAETSEWTPSNEWFDDFVADKIYDASNAVGTDLNRLVIGRQAWIIRNSTIGAGNYARNFNATQDSTTLGNQLRVDIMIPDARINNNGVLFPPVATDKVYGFIGQDGVSTEDMSNLKTFVGKGGLKMNSWDHPQGELEIITVSRWQSIQATSPLGVFSIAVSKE